VNFGGHNKRRRSYCELHLPIYSNLLVFSLSLQYLSGSFGVLGVTFDGGSNGAIFGSVRFDPGVLVAARDTPEATF
jgi:hypothetical protein